MAYIRAHETTQRRNGKAVKRYEVVFSEFVRDEMGLPVPVDPAKPSGRKKTRDRQESFATREDAEARRDELNVARHTLGTSSLADQRKAGDLPFAHYAHAWLDTVEIKVARGQLKQRTLDDNRRLLKRYVLDKFGGQAIATISPRHCEEFLAALVNQRSRQGADGVLDNTLAPATVKHAWATFGRVLKYAMQHNAIVSNPADRVDFSGNRATGDRERFEHHPLTAAQVAQLSAAVAGAVGGLPAYPIYALMVDFLAYSGVRAAENTGLEVGDLTFTNGAHDTDGSPTVRCAVQVRRTKERKNGQWVTTTPKSRKSRRTVPLPPWLAERMQAYLADDHPCADEPTAPLWPTRKNGGGYRAAGTRYAVPLDWSQPLAMGAFYDTIFRPALVAVGLPASAPAQGDTPAVRGVRIHDLRHSMATMQLMAGTHFMQVSKWLGHSTFTLTLDTYGDWIPEEDGGAGNLLPPPPSATPQPSAQVPEPSNVVQLFGRRLG